MNGERAVVEVFWRLMVSNVCTVVGAVLADDFVLEWPQTGECFRGRERSAAENDEYPAHGAWRFEVHRIVAGDGEAVSVTTVTDGVVIARALSFSTVRDGLIARLVEHWPEPAAPSRDRSHLAEPLDRDGRLPRVPSAGSHAGARSERPASRGSILLALC